jgi:hypothetical protein
MNFSSNPHTDWMKDHSATVSGLQTRSPSLKSRTWRCSYFSTTNLVLLAYNTKNNGNYADTFHQKRDSESEISKPLHPIAWPFQTIPTRWPVDEKLGLELERRKLMQQCHAA